MIYVFLKTGAMAEIVKEQVQNICISKFMCSEEIMIGDETLLDLRGTLHDLRFDLKIKQPQLYTLSTG